MHSFQFIYLVTDETAKMCDPWENRDFLHKIDLMPDGTCEYCLPDCSTTIYDHEVSSAPVKDCDHTNLGTSNICQVNSLSIKQNINPPPFVNNIISQFKDDSEQIPQFATEMKMFSNMRYHIKESKIATAVFRYKVKDKPTYNAFDEDITIVNFYFGKSTAWEFQHAPSKTMGNYIAELGGLLGLFTGFSFLSAVEIIYWIIIPFMKKFAVPVKGVK